MKFLTLSIAILSALTKIYSQDNFQQIRGTITDKESLSILRGATVLLSNSNDSIRISDDRGQYKFSNVKPGRYEVKVFYNGYAEVNIPNIEVTSGRESIIDISLVEKVRQLKRVKISGQKKSGTINELATNSARTFSMEEVNRYAGGRSDAARLASNFAGVSTPDDSRNDIVIRGNSPTGVLWRLEGMNIPNPNHFATVGTTGGPVSALNTNMLKNSDFFTSAFPAEYGNANAGVFDINLRKGNSEKYEHMFQLGALTGLEAVSEGPFRKGSGASYVVAYRYSFAGIAQSIGIPIGTTATPFYTDLTFKINTAESKLGKFTVFGLAGYSNIEFLHNKIDSTDLFANPNADSYFKSLIGVLGIKHAIKINDKSYWNTVIGGSIANSEFDQDSLDKPNNRSGRVIENIGKRNVYNINTNFNSKVNSQLFVKIGAQADLMTLDLFFRDRNKKTDWVQYWDFKDATVLTQHYAQAKYSFTDKIIANLGIHSQYLTLNNSFAIEPRLGIKYIATPKSTLSIGYGIHSQMQSVDVYFYRSQNQNGTYDQSNLNLDFSRSQHLVFGYDFLPAKNWRIKAEAYYQNLWNVPISTTDSSFSVLNSGATFAPVQEGNLVNNGTGNNYGLELTIEKFFSQGYYALITSTIYNSKYKGSDDIERNTAFNGQYVFNILGGKEFKVGKNKNNNLTFDLKATYAGGRHFTPVDLVASQAKQSEVLQKGNAAFSQQFPSYFRTDFKMGYTMNFRKAKVSQSIFLDMQNITGNKNVFASRYNEVNQSVNTAYQIGFVPNFTYKLLF